MTPDNVSGYAAIITLPSRGGKLRDIIYIPSIRRTKKKTEDVINYVNRLRVEQGAAPYPIIAIIPVSVIPQQEEEDVAGKP